MTYEIDEMAVRNVNTRNDVNRASAATVKQSPAFGRGRGHKAAQVVTKRNPCELFSCTEKLFIGTWNIRTLFTAGSLDILLYQLHDYRWSIVGLAETRWTGAGEFTKDDYRIIYSGRKDDKHQESLYCKLFVTVTAVSSSGNIIVIINILTTPTFILLLLKLLTEHELTT